MGWFKKNDGMSHFFIFEYHWNNIGRDIAKRYIRYSSITSVKVDHYIANDRLEVVVVADETHVFNNELAERFLIEWENYQAKQKYFRL